MSTHLEEYLDYYKNLRNPGYGVLVTGEWGVGKTFQVKACLAEKERYYVSLFGLETADQVHASVIAEIDPKMAKANKLLKGFGETAKVVGGVAALGGLLPGLFQSLLQKELKPDRVLVFDDLERSDLSPKGLFGVINAYVEHHGFCVVVIAHDEELESNLGEMKEKLFGQTIRVEPDVEAAFVCFFEDAASNDSQDFIQEHRQTIITVFQQSKAQSLRILRHVVEDLGRLHRALKKEHLNHSEAIRALVEMFCALNIEVRDGGLKEVDLRSRQKYWEEAADSEDGPEDRNNGPKKREKWPIQIAAEKYPNIHIRGDMLNSDVLVQMFVEGSYRPKAIQQSLDASLEFAAPRELAPWRRVIEFGRLDDKVVEAAVKEMNLQFVKREVTDSGEMLHIFSLRMMMSENRILDQRINEVEASCLKYIDDLLKSENLPPRETDYHWFGEFDHAHGNYGFWVTEATQESFNKVRNHLKESREQALEKQFPRLIKELLKLVKTDGREFFEQVCSTNNGENPYALIPILAHMDAKVFVDAWLASPNENWHFISSALKERYGGPRIQNELSGERAWAIKVHDHLQDAAERADGFRALRILRTRPKVLKDLAEDDETGGD